MEQLKELKLSRENSIHLCELRLKNEGEEFTEIIIEDDSFKHFNGISFIVKSDQWQDYRFTFPFTKFYPNEFKFLIDLGFSF